MRIIVNTQVFENYALEAENLKDYAYKYKSGDTYECIVPNDVREQNVVGRMLCFITNNLKNQQDNDILEFPTTWDIMEDDEKTSLEESYASYGDEMPLIKLQYKDGEVSKID